MPSMFRMPRLTALLVTLFAFAVPAGAMAQDGAAPYGDPQQQMDAPPPADQQPGEVAPPPQSLAPQAFSQEQIEQLLAPVALYPDQLLGQVLMASTYPLEVVEADRWRQQNSSLQGDALASAVDQQSWDPSVKSLVQFPQVLSMMDKNLEWTEQLGNAFLAQQAAVSTGVQNLRQRAQQAGNLSSTPQQTVSADQGAIEIAPAQSDVVYVPQYNPQVVYGAWPYAGYPPYYFPPPAGYYYGGPYGYGAGVIAFGVGIGVADLLWGWSHWDWFHHSIIINDGRFAEINRGRGPIFSGAWEHDPWHRHGVPYNNSVVRQHYAAQASVERANYRGYEASHNARPLTGAMPHAAAGLSATHATAEHAAATNHAAAGHDQWMHMGQAPQARPAERSSVPQARAEERPQNQFATHSQAQPRAVTQTHFQPPQRSAPVFESFSRGSDVRAQSQRGAFSRASTPAPEHMQSHAAAPRSAPAAHSVSGGGGHGGGGGDSHDGHR